MCSDCWDDYDSYIDEDNLRQKIKSDVEAYLKSVDVESPGWILTGVLGVIEFGYNKYPKEERELRDKIFDEIMKACACSNCRAVANFVVGNPDFTYSASK